MNVSTMVSHIRSILDENETNTELSGVSGVRQLTVEDVITNHLVSGIDAITLLAPAYLIDPEISTEETEGRLIIPNDALKVICVRAKGWNRSVTEVHSPAESLYKAARHGRVGSLCNANNPLAFEMYEVVDGDPMRVLECYPELTSTASGYIQYVKKASITSTTVNVCDKLYEPACLYIAGLVCDSMGWAKNRDYKQDALLMLGIQMQQPEQVNG